MARVFISYHRQTDTDRALARRLYEELKRHGHAAFIDSDIPPGAKWDAELERELARAELVVVLLSASSVERDYVHEEVRRARRDRIPLLPVRVQFTGELPYRFGALLNSIQHAHWSSPEDDTRLLEHLLARLQPERQEVDPAPSGADAPPLGTSLLTDNWLLKEVGELLSGEVDRTPSLRLEVDAARDSHRWSEVPGVGVQVEALLSLLSEVVLREKLVVDQGFVEAWDDLPSLAPLKEAGLVSPIDFRAHQAGLPQARTRMLEKLCATDSLRLMQRQNERSLKERSQLVDNNGSLLIWGTAGYLARAHLSQLVYAGHPLRRDVVSQTLRSNVHRDVQEHVERWLQRQRVRLFDEASPEHEARGVSVVFPPIAVEVIESCSSLEDLLPTALQARQQYAELRRWLSAYQKAFEDEEPRAMLKHKKDLDEAENALNRELRESSFGATCVDVNVDWYGSPDASRSRVSARTILSQLIFVKKGEGSLRRLLRLLGEEQSALGDDAVEYLRQRMTPPRG